MTNDMEDVIKEIAAYCAAHIEDYEIRVHLAIKQMDRMRCPLSMADERLYNEMYNCAEEWADDHDYSVDFIDGIDVEEILWAE